MTTRELLNTVATAGEIRAFEAGYAGAVALHGEERATSIGLGGVKACGAADLKSAWTPAEILSALRARPQVWA